MWAWRRRSAAASAARGSGFERRPLSACPACGGELTETEERRRETKAGFATRREAQAALSKLLVAIEERRHVPKSHLTLREFLRSDWLPAIASTVRPTTYAQYTSNCEQHIIPFLGSVASAAHRRREAQRPLRAPAQRGPHPRIRRPLPRHGRRVHATLHRAFRDAVRWGYLAANPAAAADPPREYVLARERPSWSSEELAAFLQLRRGRPPLRPVALSGLKRLPQR